MKYVFIDTNIFIYCTLLMKRGHNPTALNRLREIIEQNEARLLLPEMVELEYEGQIEHVHQDVRKEINSLAKTIQSVSVPDFLKDDKKKLEKITEDMQKTREENKSHAQKEILKIFNHQNVVRIPLNNEILINGIRRVSLGKKPSKHQPCIECGGLRHPIDNDSIIIESLIFQLNHLKIDKPDILYFCSDNRKDFAYFNKEVNNHQLHEEIDNDLPITTRYFHSLETLLKVEFKKKVKERELEEPKEFFRKTYTAAMSWRQAMEPYIKSAQTLKEAMESQVRLAQTLKEAMEPYIRFQEGAAQTLKDSQAFFYGISTEEQEKDSDTKEGENSNNDKEGFKS